MATTAQCCGAGPGRTEGDSHLWRVCPFYASFWWGSRTLVNTGPSKSDPLTCALVAHLLQQAVDERVSEHVEETASSH